MIDALKALLRFRSEGHEGIGTPRDEDAEFVLAYEELPVGYLRLHEGRWQYRYAREFRHQSQVKPLVDFPDVDKVYESTDLWPFFLSRIPSLAQPQVQEVIHKEGLDEHSDVDLLRRFGTRSISNPFVLKYTIPGAA